MAEIITLGGTFKSYSELKQYTDAQYIALKGAAEKIRLLETEITHLQQLLAQNTTLIEDSNIERIIKTPELAICEAQIQILQNRALQKELTLEEVKTLDLLIKNKRLILGDATTIDGQVKKKSKPILTEAELVKIAKIEDKNE